MKLREEKEINFKLNSELWSNIPAMEGGVDYKKQVKLLEYANLALIDENKRME